MSNLEHSALDADHSAGAIVLVGDRFEPFIATSMGVSPHDFAAAVDKGDYDDVPGAVSVQIGQGVDEHDLAGVAAAIDRRDLGERLLLRPSDLPIPVEPAAVHKHDLRNVLVADFERVEKDVFEASLRLHNDSELLFDHQSGVHVQGMVLVEAARQMFLAVCELDYLRRWADRKLTYLMPNLNTRFERPVFPLPAQMRLTAHRAEAEEIDRISLLVETQILQGGLEVSSTVLECVVRPTERMSRLEQRTAAAVIAKLPKAR